MRDLWRDDTTAALERIEDKLDAILAILFEKEIQMNASFENLAAAAAALAGPTAAAAAALATHNETAIDSAALDAVTEQINSALHTLSAAVAAPTTVAVADAVTTAVAAVAPAYSTPVVAPEHVTPDHGADVAPAPHPVEPSPSL